MCRGSRKHVLKWRKPGWKERKLRGKRQKPQGKKDGNNNKRSKSYSKRCDQPDDPCRDVQPADLRVSDEGIFEMISKKEFIKHLEALIIADGRSCVQNVVYTKDGSRERIRIIYTGGAHIDINVSCNSNGANLLEVAREVYGNGAFGRMPDYE